MRGETVKSSSNCSVTFVFCTSIRDEHGAVFRTDESAGLNYPQISLINCGQTICKKFDALAILSIIIVVALIKFYIVG
jgi:hypothetical protein